MLKMEKEKELIQEHLQKALDHIESAEKLMEKNKEWSVQKSFLNTIFMKLRSVLNNFTK
jgi:hypothetical protein